jgi:molybdopterin-containing oxidoreductase family iron-sulfur binding subunit
MSDVTNPAPQAGVTYWRSLDQFASQDASAGQLQDILDREFPADITEEPDEVSRRGFLSAVAASVALAGMTSCRKPKTLILPFNKRPEGFRPGMSQHYATALSRGAWGLGVLVRSSDGRPTKIEGNPDHPSTLGGSDALLQAELLQVYDPDRSPAAWKRGAAAHEAATHEGSAHGEAKAPPKTAYEEFSTFWYGSAPGTGMLKKLLTQNGARLRVLMPPTASPSLLGMVGKLKDLLPQCHVQFWEPLHRDQQNAGAVAAFGKAVETHVDYTKADVVVSFDCDFLATDGNTLRSARHWASRRTNPKPGQPLSRLYVCESVYSTTGTAADHRFRARQGDIPTAVFALAAALGVGAGTDLAAKLAAHSGAQFTKNGKPWIAEVAKDLQAARGRCVVVAGPRQPAAVHAVVHAINHALGNVGATVAYTLLPEALARSCVESIQALKAAIDKGEVDVLVCLGTNPVYDAPVELGFGKLLADKKVEHTIHVGSHNDETAVLCEWHFPLAHELEGWGDTRARDGTVALQQPLIAPLHGGVTALEFLALLGQRPNTETLVTEREGTVGYELLREHWKAAAGVSDFEGWWRRALHDGVVPNSQFPVENTSLNAGTVAAEVQKWTRPADAIEVALRACTKMWDGRYANNSWMQELPDPVTKLCWDNAALLSPATAQGLGVQNGDLLAISAGGQLLEIPAWLLPGHADKSVTIALGWGRDLHQGKIAKGTGRNAYQLRTGGAQWLVAGAQVGKGNGTYKLVCTQEHGTMMGRAIVREESTATYQRDPEWAPKMSALDQAARLQGKREPDLNKSLWTERFDQQRGDPEIRKSPYQWGMVIDLNACTGCSACVAACIAENNIPVVGKTQVGRNREMFWIRADRYFSSPKTPKAPGSTALVEKTPEAPEDDPQVANMPTPCMHCENAPCESVCPVAATTHSPDGLNDMVYNRCIGTRYCSNNCPYKVRRFNYLDYLGQVPETKKMAFNPDVTVRSRGVMEKCTYCVQRINGARIHAKLQGRQVRDGEIAPACGQACPTQAITFGNIIDTTSRVAQLRASPLNYGVLSDLNTKPRTTYLGRVRNPNPNLV